MGPSASVAWHPGAVPSPVNDHPAAGASHGHGRGSAVPDRPGLELERYRLEDLSARQSGKWRRVAPGDIAAWVADMDFPVAPVIREVLERAVATDDLGYPASATIAAARAAFAERLASRHGLAVSAQDVLLSSDVVQCMYLGIETLTEPGDGVLFLTPTYPPFFSAVADTRRRAVTVDLHPGPDRFELDLEHLEAVARRERPRCLLLCNPHNPTGRAFGRDELEALAALCCELDLVVLADEIHADLVLPGASHVAFGSLGPEIAGRTVTLTSASKAFNIAGLRCAAAAFGSTALRERFEQVPAGARGGVGSLGMLAAISAYETGDEWLESVLGLLDANRRTLAEWAAGVPDLVYRAPEATYLAWLDLRALGLGDDPAAELERSARVVLSPGPSFGEAGKGHARLNFATSPAVLAEMLGRIGAVLGG